MLLNTTGWTGESYKSFCTINHIRALAKYGPQHNTPLTLCRLLKR